MNVLVLNSGSSSLKFQIIATDLERMEQHRDQRLCRGEIERIGGEAMVTFESANHEKRTFTTFLPDLSRALDYLIRFVASERSGIAEVKNSGDIHAVGHRVVHGGEFFSESARVDSTVLQKFKRFKGHTVRASQFLQRLATEQRAHFVHWDIGMTGVFN